MRVDAHEQRPADAVGPAIVAKGLRDHHQTGLGSFDVQLDPLRLPSLGEQGGLGDIKYPLVADLTKSIARDYGVLIEGAGIALRGLFLIDKAGIVRHQLINDLPLGRSVDEALRMLDALQFFEQNGEVCPANWKPGSATIKPDPEGSKKYFSQCTK